MLLQPATLYTEPSMTHSYDTPGTEQQRGRGGISSCRGCWFLCSPSGQGGVTTAIYAAATIAEKHQSQCTLVAYRMCSTLILHLHEHQAPGPGSRLRGKPCALSGKKQGEIVEIPAPPQTFSLLSTRGRASYRDGRTAIPPPTPRPPPFQSLEKLVSEM